MNEDDYLHMLTGNSYATDDPPPGCNGKGLYFMSRDMHRSAGWVPCWCERCKKYREEHPEEFR